MKTAGFRRNNKPMALSGGTPTALIWRPTSRADLTRTGLPRL